MTVIGEKVGIFIKYLTDKGKNETKDNELQGEDLEIYKKIESYIQDIKPDSNQYNNAVSNAVNDFYYTKRMKKQALLIPKDDLDVIFLQEASKETVDIYSKALGNEWQAVYDHLPEESDDGWSVYNDETEHKDNTEIYPTVTFIRQERLSLTSKDNPGTYETNAHNEHNEHIKYCQTIDVTTSNNRRLELVNYWGQVAFGEEEGITRADRLLALEQRLTKPLNGCSMRILGGDTNLHLQGLGDEMTCAGSSEPTQHDVILSSKGDGVIKNETLLKSSYCRNISACDQRLQRLEKIQEKDSNIQLKIEMLKSISAQISRIEKTQTWFWRWFYKDGSQKIAVLDELSACIYMADKDNLKNKIENFLSALKDKKTNSSILKESRSFNLFTKPESYNAVEEIKNKPNVGK